jgi:hypothetical protein
LAQEKVIQMTRSKRSQRGAVAIMVGLTLIVLIGMLALVIDLGHGYLVKAELQNAADAAALAGARSLNGKINVIINGKPEGIQAAKAAALLIARNNYYAFGIPVADSTDKGGLLMYAGTCQYDHCMREIDSITTDADAAGRTFFKVDTGTRDIATWFARVLSFNTLTPSAIAVAGHYVVEITPVGICELDHSAPEYGFERGMTYRVTDANPIGSGTPLWIDPLEASPTPCDPKSNNPAVNQPYVCGGRVGFTPLIGQTIYTNTGMSVGPLYEALDSRFDVFNNLNKCDPASSPPDTNIREYRYNDSGPWSPNTWMSPPALLQQSVTFDGTTHKPAINGFKDYGVLWSAYRPEFAAEANTIASVQDFWSTNYGAVGVPGTYPQSSPYSQTSGDYFQSPNPNHPGQPGRRELKLAILKLDGVNGCRSVDAHGICQPVEVVAIGKFFMQGRANDNYSSDVKKNIYAEFGGLLQSPFPPSEIRLYQSGP